MSSSSRDPGGTGGAIRNHSASELEGNRSTRQICPSHEDHRRALPAPGDCAGAGASPRSPRPVAARGGRTNHEKPGAGRAQSPAAGCRVPSRCNGALLKAEDEETATTGSAESRRNCVHEALSMTVSEETHAARRSHDVETEDCGWRK